MKKIVCLGEKIALGCVCALALAAYILSAVQGGIAHAGNGMPVINSGMTPGVLLFLAGMLIVAAVYAVYRHVGVLWLRILGFSLTGGSFVIVALTEWLIDGYTWTTAYLSSVTWEWLGRGWYTVFTAGFVVCAAAACALWFVIWARSGREEKKA